jgi:superfamily I DNA/RNA helicase
MTDTDRPAPQQDDIVDSHLVPMAITACAGSGKTRTAVRRVASIREKAEKDRGLVLLLSFSNVAVDTFTKAYAEFARKTGRGPARDRVRIQTIDGFLTNDILRPHAYRTMQCRRIPFLVNGSEDFLKGYDFGFRLQKSDGSGSYPVQASDLSKLFVRNAGTNTAVYMRRHRGSEVEILGGLAVLNKWAAVGAYTHAFGQYWAYQTLINQPWLPGAMARRYPHILVDEAQDIGEWHRLLLEQLIARGAQVSLIGDPHQAIYAFAGADGKFLETYGIRKGIKPKHLSINFRSVQAVQDAANLLSNRDDESGRTAGCAGAGAFFLPYHVQDLRALEGVFIKHVQDNGLSVARSAVICRGQALKKRLRAYESEQGKGVVKWFAGAALLRDEAGDYHGAYKKVVAGVEALLVDPPRDIVSQLSSPWKALPEMRSLTRLIWEFTRDPKGGLPAATLQAKAQWLPKLIEAVDALLARIRERTNFDTATSLGRMLTRAGLPEGALLPRSKGEAAAQVLRASTVHGVKGDSLDAVLYITEKDHAEALAGGTSTEVGRIGYVALTRAKDIFWMAVPARAIGDLGPKLVAKGLVARSEPGIGELDIKVKTGRIRVTTTP